MRGPATQKTSVSSNQDSIFHLAEEHADTNSTIYRPRKDRTALQSTLQQGNDTHVLPYAIATSESTSPDNQVAIQNVQDSLVEKSITDAHRNERGAASQLMGLSRGQRLSSSKNSNTDSGGDHSKGIPAPSGAEEPLPDDNSLSYIGMPWRRSGVA